MTMAVVVLAHTTAVDLNAARRMGRYGTLDDIGVIQAVEQRYRQYPGRAALPDLLCRIDRIGALVIENERPRIVSGLDSDDEKIGIQRLFEAWPASESVLVDWHGTTRAFLQTRAIAHDLVMPTSFQNARIDALKPLVTPRSVASDESEAAHAEAEALSILSADNLLPDDNATFDVLDRAIARYRVWIRARYCQGHIDTRTRAQLESRLTEQQPVAVS